MVKDAGGMEVSGSNSGKIFFDSFGTPFYPVVTALLEYLNPAVLHLFDF